MAGTMSGFAYEYNSGSESRSEYGHKCILTFGLRRKNSELDNLNLTS